jgi:hypothetical protein
MKTFMEFLQSEGVIDTLKKHLSGQKKPAPHKNDTPHYRTNHHYGHGDIEPSSVPVFKSSLDKH